VPKNSIYKGRIGPGWHNRGSPRTYNRNRGTRSAWTMPKRACSGHQRLHALRALRKVPRLRCPPSSNMWPWTHGPRKKKNKTMGCFFRRLHQTPPSQRPLLRLPELLGSDSDLLPEPKFQGGWVSVGRWVWSCDPSNGFGPTIQISQQAWQSVNDGFRLVGWRFPVRKIHRRFWTSKDERTSAFEL
jgi:hypothetical protein